eukprot:9308325-Pyramimonas_sp.AAC.1
MGSEDLAASAMQRRSPRKESRAPLRAASPMHRPCGAIHHLEGLRSGWASQVTRSVYNYGYACGAHQNSTLLMTPSRVYTV